MSSERLDLLVVCSGGGHLSDAVALSGAWAGRSRAWVSFNAPDVRSRLASERVFVAHSPTNRNVPNLLRNLRMAWLVTRRVRPRVVLTTGAGVGVPFAWIARLRGAQVIYVECAGRTDAPSLSARMIAPVASRIYAQWAELAESWPAARYAGNVLTASGEGAGPDASGVLVTVGTSDTPFDRLLNAVERIGERLTVQHGPSSVRPEGARCFGVLPPEQLDGLIRLSRVVVTHAGIGSVAAALAHGRRPIVVPRLARLGEAVDDHQVSFARRLASAGLATLVENLDDLADVVAHGDHAATAVGDSNLAAAIGRELDELLAAS
jgi:UDP-N-acetylglucosamine transferase subunit ALG13